MPIYDVACTFVVYTSVMVEANSCEEAEEIARANFDPAEHSAEIMIDVDDIVVDPQTIHPDDLESILRA